MNRSNLSLITWALGVLAGCTAEPTDDISKEEVRLVDKADWPIDYCEELGWYGDGICDDFCPLPDPDCDVPEHQCSGFADDACEANEYCDWSDDVPACGAADHLGTCEPRPEACYELYAPVCGCDNITYGNECFAHAAGTDVAYEGECEIVCPLTGIVCALDCPGSGTLPSGAPCSLGTFNAETCECEPPPPPGRSCGGFADEACAPNEYCDWSEDVPACGAADHLGTCVERPDVCYELYAPVVGCDGLTYGNDCYAHAAGTDVAFDAAPLASCASLDEPECALRDDCIWTVSPGFPGPVGMCVSLSPEPL